MSHEDWIVDPCPDANGHFTIRLDDGTEHGDTDAQPIATAYTLKDANEIVIWHNTPTEYSPVENKYTIIQRMWSSSHVEYSKVFRVLINSDEDFMAQLFYKYELDPNDVIYAFEGWPLHKGEMECDQEESPKK